MKTSVPPLIARLLPLLAAVAAAVGTYHFVVPGQADRIAAGLPPPAAFAGKPASLQTLIQTAEAAVRSDPSPATVEALGRLYHANGLIAPAEACWRILRTEDPDNGRWPHYLAQLARLRSDDAATARELALTVERAPAYAPAWLQRAELAFKTGDTATAREAYAQRLALLPGDPYARLGRVRLDLRNGDREAARRELTAITTDAPDFPGAHNLLAEIAAEDGDGATARQHRWLGHEAGRFEDAPDPWVRELNDACFDPPLLRVLGMREYQNGRPEAATAIFERAVEVAPDDPGGRELLGDLYLKLDALERAGTSLRQARDLFANRGEAAPISLYLNLSEVLRRTGDAPGAVTVLDAGLREHPDTFELHNARGVSLQYAGRTDEAIAAFRRALALNPNDADTNFNLADVLFGLGRREEAVPYFKQSLVQQPTYARSLTFLALHEMGAGRLDAAGDYVRPLYDAYWGVPDVRRITATWHLRSGIAAQGAGNTADALNHFREGYAIEPTVPGLAANLGSALLTAGQLAPAREPLEQFSRLEPQNPQSAVLLAQVYARLSRFAEARQQLTAGVQLAEQAGNAQLAAFCREMLAQLPRR